MPTLNTRLQLKIDSYENWTNWYDVDGEKTSAPSLDANGYVDLQTVDMATYANKGAALVLNRGEIGLCEIGSTVSEGNNQATNPPTVLFKVGDGVTPFCNLKWASALAADVHGWAKKSETDFLTWLSEGASTKFVTTSTLQNTVTGINDSITELNGKIDGIEIPSLAGYATIDYVDNSIEDLIGADDQYNGPETIAGVHSVAAEAKADASEAITKLADLIPDSENDVGKSIRVIANEELAAALIPQTAAESLDSLQEIAAWIQAHPEDAAALNRDIENLKLMVGGLGTKTEGETTKNLTVKEYVDEKVALETTNRNDTITSIIEGLYFNEEVLNANRTIQKISQQDGKINVTFQDISITKSQVTDFEHNHDNDYANRTDFAELSTKAICDGDTIIINCGSSTDVI